MTRKTKCYFQQLKALSSYTQLLGLEEAIGNTAVCALHTSGSTVVLAVPTVSEGFIKLQSTINPAGYLRRHVNV